MSTPHSQMSTPGSSQVSSSGHKYEQMLMTVTSLQGDLQRTLGVCQALRTENDKLKSNYETVKVELLRVREKASQTRSQLLEAVEAKMASDRDTEALVYKWKVQLEARTKELADLQAKLAPQDLDTLRARIQEELEEPHQRKIAALEAEAEKYRVMFFNIRREYERCKAEYEQYTIDQGKEVEALHQSYKGEAQALKTRVRDLESALTDASRDDDVRKLQRRVEELQSTERLIRDEMDALRADKDKIEVDRHRLVLAHQSELSRLHTANGTADVEKQRLLRLVEELKAEVGKHKSEGEDMKTQLVVQQREVVRLREQCEARDKQMLECRDECKEQVDRLTDSYHHERSDFRTANEQLSKRAAAAELRCREVMMQAQERVRQAQQMEERARADTKAEVAKLQGEIERLEEELDRLSAVARASEASTSSHTQRWQAEAETARSDTHRLQREKEALHGRMTQMTSEKDKARQEAASLAKALDEEKAQHQTHLTMLREEQENTTVLKSEMSDLLQRLRVCEEEVAVMSGEMDQQRDDHLVALQDIKTSCLNDREAYARRARAEIDKLRQKAKKVIKKEKKKAAIYKNQALEAHKKGTRARQALALQAYQNFAFAGVPGPGTAGVNGNGLSASSQAALAAAAAAVMARAGRAGGSNSGGGGGGERYTAEVMELSKALARARGLEKDGEGMPLSGAGAAEVLMRHAGLERKVGRHDDEEEEHD